MMMAEHHSHDETPPVYRRELPGGGYVAIAVAREERRPEAVRTLVRVERRSREERRAGHLPVVIAEAEGDERSPGFGELYRIATDNAAIARALLQIEGPEILD